jgi:hypothetical protein
MKFNELTNNATRAFHRVGFKLKKHSPEILVVTGVIGGVVSAVMACKATTKVNFVLEETKRQIDIIHESAEAGEVQGYMDSGEVGMVPYTAEDAKKDTAIVYGQTTLKFIKLYGPSVALGTLSVASILTGHNMLRKRNLALAAAYQVVDTGFKQYRNNVVERFGEQMDRELKYNIKAKEIEETVIDKKGKEKTVKKTIEVGDPSRSPYTFCFDESSCFWERDAESNKFFLMRQQDYANEKLRARGHLFLNEVLDMVGLNHTRAGAVVGWVYDEANPIGDNCIDFGIFDIHCEAARNFVNGLEKSIWLNFNVDGDILEHL